jgi:ApeA N-terminal domain 1
MTKYLSESADWSGYFWLPGKRGQAQAGVLSYTPDHGLLLSLIGGFNDARWEPNPAGGSVLSTPTREWAVVHGFAENKPITLLDCVAQRWTGFGFGGNITQQEIRAEQALVGIILDDEASAPFVGIEVQVENLTEWGAQSPIS